jgi:hypothetical protein
MPFPPGTRFETLANMQITYRVRVKVPGSEQPEYKDGFKSFEEAEA